MSKRSSQSEQRRQESASTVNPDTNHDDSATPINPPLPRAKRRRRRARADRGLPPDNELVRLADSYLERQRKLWPKLAKNGALPAMSEAVIQDMVDDFKRRHRTGNVDREVVVTYLKHVKKLGGSYNRFSCDNSDPLSIVDQLHNQLDVAKEEDRFVPWAYVFCDYSVSGLDNARQGYRSYKSILEHEAHLIETTYIDDFTRASRDEIEWWRLGALSKRLSKRMIGASDGFDLSDPNWDIWITIFGLLSRLFIKSLRQKVKRGMGGAARRGTSLGKPSLGFTRRVLVGSNGNIVRRPDGRPRHEPCVDPVTVEYRILLYHLFVDKCWSAGRIARHFNELKVDGSDSWTASSIKNLLRNPSAIGVLIWNINRREFDWEEEKIVKIPNPLSEWEHHYDPALAIVPYELWKAGYDKLAASRAKDPRTGKKVSRNQISATTLFSGTLICPDCGVEITLTRSTAKYKQLGCPRGRDRRHGCKLSTSKSVRIVEECLLDFIRGSVFTESAMEDLVEKGNEYLSQLADTPQIDTRPLKAEIRERESKIRKLVRIIEDEPDEDACRGYHNRIKEHQEVVDRLRLTVQEADARSADPPRPLDRDRVQTYLEDLRETLNQEIPMAAEAIRTLTGPIEVRQEKDPTRKHGATWIATFSPDLLKLLGQIGQKKDYPESSSLELLSSSKWIIPEKVEVPIIKVPDYERLAPKFKELEAKGTSIQTLASAHHMSWNYVKEIIHFAETGERPNWKSGGKRDGERRSGPPKYKVISDNVARLRDRDHWPFVEIKAWIQDKKGIDVSIETVQRAYDHARPDVLQEAIEKGHTPDRGTRAGPGEERDRRIHELLRQGTRVVDIAEELECGLSTVYRVKRRMGKRES